jgi:hypothetical protein
MLHEKVVLMIIVNYQIYLVLHLFLFNNQNLNHHHYHLLLVQLKQHLSKHHNQLHKYDHHNFNNSDQFLQLVLFHRQHRKLQPVNYLRFFFLVLIILYLDTQTDQQVQSLRLKQEQFQKLAFQAKQKGIFILLSS